MALIKCPECENQISELASRCPHCGFPLSNEVVLKIKNEDKRRIEEELEAKEKKEREQREFLASLDIDNSKEEKTPVKEIHPQTSESKKRKRKIISYTLIASFFILVVILVLSSLNTEQTNVPQNKAANSEELLSDKINDEANLEVLIYKIVNTQDVSYLNTPRMVYRIILDVDSVPTETVMKKVAFDIWEKGNKSWKEFTVFIYLPEMNTESTAFGVTEFNNNGFVSFNLNEFSLYGTKWQ